MLNGQVMLPWDRTFPREVTHIANPDMKLMVVFYGALSTPQGSVPVVATGPVGGYWAGEAALLKGVPTLMAVNYYADVVTAKEYARRIFVL